MKHALCMFPILLLVIGVAACAAEEAVLHFQSFDGGGHVYTVEVDDPSILACEAAYDYGGDDAEVVDGASYTMVFTFTGLEPGETTVSVYGRSPILDNDDAVYTATVDEALNVTLVPVRAISTLFVYRSGDDRDYDSFRIAHEQDGYHVSVNDGPEQSMDAASMDALMRGVDQYDLSRWDGFGETKIGVAHGEDFWLEIRLTDGAHVLARGQNTYPEDYFPAMNAIYEILDGAEIGGEQE